MKIYPHLSEAIANTVEILRKEKGMTKSSLSDLAELERCYLLGITKGQRNPTVNAVFSLCEALQVSPVHFFQLVVEELDRLRSLNDSS